MNQETEQRIRERVKRNLPEGARGYFLSNTLGRFPSTGAYPLEPFQYPYALPMGSYRLFFTNSIHESSALEQKIPGTPPPTIEIWQSETHIAARTELAAHPADEGKSSVAETKPAREKWQDDPRHINDRIEYQAERFSDELQENKALVGKRLRHSAEVAEGFVLQRAYRHELVAAAQNFSAFQEQQVALFEKMSETHLNLAARLQAPTPPTPPPPASPDHLGQNLPALLMLGNTLIKRLLGDDKDDDEGMVDATLDDDRSKLRRLKKKLEVRIAKLEQDKRTKKSTAKKAKDEPRRKGSGHSSGKEKAKPGGKTKNDPKKRSGSMADKAAQEKPTAKSAKRKEGARKADRKRQAPIVNKTATRKKVRRAPYNAKGALESGMKERGS